MRQWTPLAVAVPAATLQTAPVSKTWRTYPSWIHRFEIEIPRGHRGLTGVRVTYHGTPVIPFDPALFLVGDGRTFTVPYEDETDGSGLVVQAFNTDSFPHSFYLYADVDPYLPRDTPGSIISPRAAVQGGSLLDQIALLSSPGGAR